MTLPHGKPWPTIRAPILNAASTAAFLHRWLRVSEANKARELERPSGAAPVGAQGSHRVSRGPQRPRLRPPSPRAGPHLQRPHASSPRCGRRGGSNR